MSANQDYEDSNSAADDIAATITKILVDAFTSKEGREPTADEVQQLIEELTEERIESMLGGFGDGDDVEPGASDEEDEEDELVKEDEAQEDLPVPVLMPVFSSKSELDTSTNSYKRTLEENEKVDTPKKDENGDPNEVKRIRTGSETEVAIN